jgi:hypothetical protein
VSSAGNAVIADQSAALSSVQAVFYKMNEGTGSSLAEDGGDGPAIAVAGSVAGAWANANWFTHDAAGNTQQIKANAYVDALCSMQSEGSIILGIDYFVTTWPSTTETMWGLHRTDTATGGVRMPLVSGSPGRFSVYYKPNGGSEVEVVGYAPGTYLGVRNSILVELRVLPALGELRVYLYHNGRLERSNVWPLGTAPATDASGGLNFSGYGGTPAQKIGSGSSVGSRTANAFVMRHSGADRNIAGRLAAYVAANQALPSWLIRV